MKNPKLRHVHLKIYIKEWSLLEIVFLFVKLHTKHYIIG